MVESIPTAPNASDQVLGRRVVAALLDILLLGIVFVLLGIITGGAHSGSSSASVTLGAGGAVVFFLIAGKYYFGCESAPGQTIGKRLVGIRVKNDDGTPASPEDSGAPAAVRMLPAESAQRRRQRSRSP